MLEIARGNRPDFFNLHYEKPTPFVPRHLRREAAGPHELSRARSWRRSISPACRRSSRISAREGVEAVAICFLHAYANPAHEEAALAEVRRLWPEVSVVASHQITREWREYERTIDRRCCRPMCSRSPSAISSGSSTGLARQGLSAAALRHAVQLRRRLARRRSSRSRSPWSNPARPPASGARPSSAAHRRAQRAGARHRRHHRQVLADRGRPGQDHDRLLDRARPHARPAIRSWCRWSTWSRSAMAAARSPGSTISASCMSARNRPAPCPGPAAYGRGGTQATTTDANLALGRINQDYFCGGAIDRRHGGASTPRCRRVGGQARRRRRSRRRAASSASPTTTWSTR